MREAPRQLVFDLPVEPGYGPEDFLVSPSNEQAYARIENWPGWSDCALLLIGPRGSGKSHLAAIWAAAAHAWIVPARDIRPEQAAHLVSSGALAVEDLDRGGIDEAALFHLLNLARERGTWLLMTASTPPLAWGLNLPDLVSRLRLAPSVALEAPDDALMKAVLVKLFVDRQLVVDTSVVDYIALRIERSLASAEKFVAALDKEALSRGRRVSRAIAAAILDAAREGEETE